MEIFAEITGIRYSPMLCSELSEYDIKELPKLLKSRKTSFIIMADKNAQFAICKWTTPKRTRTYGAARTYNILGFNGKQVSIIPLLKDEGIEGDRDYLQFDTISLMSLLGINVIIAYYNDARERHPYRNKIKFQKLDADYILQQLEALHSYRSDALHWNMHQIDILPELIPKALEGQEMIARKFSVPMHSFDIAERKLLEIYQNKEIFMQSSRDASQRAQHAESLTTQPKERLLTDEKSTITIKNYLGGLYYLTVDETIIENDQIALIESKNSKSSPIPSLDDIKDGLIKMIIFSNLCNLTVDGKNYKHKAILKLTTESTLTKEKLNPNTLKLLGQLKTEAEKNNFFIQCRYLD